MRNDWIRGLLFVEISPLFFRYSISQGRKPLLRLNASSPLFLTRVPVNALGGTRFS